MPHPLLITSYVNPDLDGVAGSMAYCELLKKTGIECTVGILGEPHEEAKYILDRFDIRYPETIENDELFDKVILIDVSDLNGLEEKVDPEKVIEIIDHRKVNQSEKFPNVKAQIELVGAAATLVAERFMNANEEISKDSATLLCSAIISNTLNFKGGVTTERDKKAFEYLSSTAVLPEYFWEELFIAKSDLSGSKLKERILGDMAWFDMDGKKVGIAQIEIIGAEDLIRNRVEEIIEILENSKKEMGFDLIFQNTIDLKDCENFFIAKDKDTQKLLEKILDVKFDGFVAERSNMIMRKQIVPLLKKELEEN